MLKGEKIILRQLKLSDWESTIKWRNDATIKQMAMMHPFPITENVEKEWYENIINKKDDKTVYFTITLRNDDPIGFITLNRINHINRNCYLGIVIGDPGSQGKGYGFESMQVVMDYVFNTLNLNKITLEVIETNHNALKLYRKLGFIEEGRLRKHYFAEGKYFDIIILSVFKP
jgi:UDP-4-amino-4,6-dideoxy-N-acetyl-beta-L-altrosamine N-acetyltransferase